MIKLVWVLIWYNAFIEHISGNLFYLPLPSRIVPSFILPLSPGPLLAHVHHFFWSMPSPLLPSGLLQTHAQPIAKALFTLHNKGFSWVWGVAASWILSSFSTCWFRDEPSQEMAPPVDVVKSIKDAARANHALSLVAVQLNSHGWHILDCLDMPSFHSFIHGHIIFFLN